MSTSWRMPVEVVLYCSSSGRVRALGATFPVKIALPGRSGRPEARRQHGRAIGFAAV